MIRSYKFRIYPTDAQQLKLLSHLDLCRNLYNGALQERISRYKYCNESLSYQDQQNSLPKVKELCPEYLTIHSQVLQDVLRRLDKSYKNFFRRIKSGEKPGFPRFQGKHRYNSFTYPQSGFRIESDGKLFLSKIGHVKIIQHREIVGEIKTCSIIRSTTGKWYACFSVETEKHSLPVTGNAIGIDLGIKNFVVTSENEIIAPQKFLNKHLERLALSSRRLSKDKKNRAKRFSLARIHEKVKNCRSDWQHKVANQLVKDNDIICVEDLNIKGMQTSEKFGSNMKRQIADASWGQLICYLSYKAECAGRELILVDPTDTSKMCSHCGKIKENLELNVRIYKCEHCQLEIDRDYNAAINVKIKGLASRSAMPESRNIFSESSLDSRSPAL